jgi:hypothetical protein
MEMKEKEMLAWARSNPQAKSDLTLDDAWAQLSEQERRDAEKTQAEMKRLGIREPARAVRVMRGKAAEKQRKLEEAAAARSIALAEDARAKAQEDADLLDMINEWRAEEPYDMPMLTALADATADERDAAEAGDSRLLTRRRK